MKSLKSTVFWPYSSKTQVRHTRTFQDHGIQEIDKDPQRWKKLWQILSWFTYSAWHLLHVWTIFFKELKIISTEEESASASESSFKDSLQMWLSKATNWNKPEKRQCRFCWLACSWSNHTESKKSQWPLTRQKTFPQKQICRALLITLF